MKRSVGSTLGLALAAVGRASRRRPPTRAAGARESARPTRSWPGSRSCTRGGSSRSTRWPARRSSRSSAARRSSSRTPRDGNKVAATWGPVAALYRLVGPPRALGRPAVHPGRIRAAEAADPGRRDPEPARGRRRQASTTSAADRAALKTLAADPDLSAAKIDDFSPASKLAGAEDRTTRSRRWPRS